MIMEFYEAVNNRRTCRMWDDRDVNRDVIDRILNAAVKAPSNDHLRQWQFVIIRTQEEKDNALQFVKAFDEKIKNGSIGNPGKTDLAQRMYAHALPRQYSMLNDCPYVILPFFKAAPAFFNPGAINSYNSFASIWCVIENIFLAASAEGLATSMRTPVGDESSLTASAVNAPDGWIFPCYIGIGYPSDDEPEIEQVPCKIEDIIHEGKWQL